MRSLKFRAWDTVSKKYLWPKEGFGLVGEVSCFSLLEQQLHELRGESYSLLSMNDVVFEQFTGLFDKSGKEIWEGDVCAFRNHDYEDWDQPMQHRGIVAFQNGTFLFVDEKGERFRFSKDGMKTEHYSLEYFECNTVNIERLGNIYENPELIK